MDIYEAIDIIERYAQGYGERYEGPGSWAPTETRIVPSGDENDTIKIWFNLGEGLSDAQVEAQRQRFVADLKEDHPQVTAFNLAVRAESF